MVGVGGRVLPVCEVRKVDKELGALENRGVDDEGEINGDGNDGGSGVVDDAGGGGGDGGSVDDDGNAVAAATAASVAVVAIRPLFHVLTAPNPTS